MCSAVSDLNLTIHSSTIARHLENQLHAYSIDTICSPSVYTYMHADDGCSNQSTSWSAATTASWLHNTNSARSRSPTASTLAWKWEIANCNLIDPLLEMSENWRQCNYQLHQRSHNPIRGNTPENTEKHQECGVCCRVERKVVHRLAKECDASRRCWWTK